MIQSNYSSWWLYQNIIEGLLKPVLQGIKQYIYFCQTGGQSNTYLSTVLLLYPFERSPAGSCLKELRRSLCIICIRKASTRIGPQTGHPWGSPSLSCSIWLRAANHVTESEGRGDKDLSRRSDSYENDTIEKAITFSAKYCICHRVLMAEVCKALCVLDQPLTSKWFHSVAPTPPMTASTV